MLTKITIILAVIGLSSCAKSIAFLPPIPKEFEGKQGCYIKEVHDVVPFGTVLTPIGNCVRISCGARQIDYATCGTAITTNPKCFVTKEDLTKPYPNCCPTVKCI
ncbi:unnamed protein product [Chilo suppressalis]|uniref:Single domain-containing protein n=1 Tax=Chilo suppressalis TaxID=168631 RepID=A0ABN8AVL4_CHISP|nr:hypothetical protein evm_008536 [Chilo suppressalis]CAH0400177.1 unnamed protein product [Chilo suppressalis]